MANEDNSTLPFTLPTSINESHILTAEDLTMLSTLQELPAVDPSYDDAVLKNIIQYYSLSPDEMEQELHLHAKNLLGQQKVSEAWQVLLTCV